MIESAKLPSFRCIYEKVKAAGLSSALIRRVVLPSWSDKADEKNEAACQSAYLEIAAKLGIAYRDLINVDMPLNLHGSVQRVAFKTGNKNKAASNLTASAHMGLRLAHIVASAYANSECFIKFNPLSAETCRQSILTGASWVSFKPLLDFCWRNGIPVVYWKGEPGQCFDGISTSIDGIPIIILGSGKNTAWTTFHLAHEVGHIMLGHTNNAQLNLDSKIEDTHTGTNKKEIAATEFGNTLLRGTQKLPHVKMDVLPTELQKISIKYRVSPATILLSNSWRSKNEKDFKILTSRLSKMRSVCDTKQVVNELLQTKIGHDFDAVLSDWQHDFLDALLG